jgi:sn-glycerol 3-phosphate transport system ATP-binding protein
MNAGRAEQIGTPAEVYGNPATTFVASFIGSPPMNLLRGTIAADGGALKVAGGAPASDGSRDLRLRLPQPLPKFAGRDVLLGIRPEHLMPAGDGIPITVEMVEVLGAEMLIHGKSGSESVIVRLPDGAHPEFGSTINLAFTGTRVHWFEPATGMRIDA